MNLKDSYTKIFLKEGNYTITDDQINKFKKVWWYNQRNKNHTALRLTDEGLSYIDKIGLKKYEVPFPDSVKINCQLLIWLDRFIDSPYYICKKSIIVTREKTALEMYLFSGDVYKYGYAKALSKKINSK